MELAMISNFTTECLTEKSNLWPLDPKLDTLTTQPSGLWWISRVKTYRFDWFVSTIISQCQFLQLLRHNTCRVVNHFEIWFLFLLLFFFVVFYFLSFINIFFFTRFVLFFFVCRFSIILSSEKFYFSSEIFCSLITVKTRTFSLSQTKSRLFKHL